MSMQLVKSNDPVLRTPTTEFLDTEIPLLGELIFSMFSTLEVKGGIGLAAPQIGVDRSIFVIDIDNVRKVFINPTIVDTSTGMEDQVEGCLSLPGLQLKVKRPSSITVMWLDEDGNKQISDLDGLWARCWLHEYDHLQGIMIDDRVSKLTLSIARKKLEKKQRLGKRN